MKNKILELVIKIANEFKHEFPNFSLNEEISKDTILYGKNGFDSMGLVLYIARVEEELAVEFNRNLILVDAKAMSQRTSPFATINSLSNHIESLLAEIN